MLVSPDFIRRIGFSQVRVWLLVGLLGLVEFIGLVGFVGWIVWFGWIGWIGWIGWFVCLGWTGRLGRAGLSVSGVITPDFTTPVKGAKIRL